jgi:hypothetical protein
MQPPVFLHFAATCLLTLVCWRCEAPVKPAGALLQAAQMPAEARPVAVRITDLNCWVEQGQFFITGLCTNETGVWQKIWLQAMPLDVRGQSLTIQGAPGAIVPVFSSAVAPLGSSAFFAGWPVKDFSGVPDSCRVSGAGAVPQSAGPILLVEQLGGVKMLQPEQEGAPATKEVAWQISGVLHNPSAQPAMHPRLELLLYGTDKRLWFSMLLNPEDPALRQLLTMEGEGALVPGAKRPFGVYAFYERLPAKLREHAVGRVEVLGFEARD